MMATDRDKKGYLCLLGFLHPPTLPQGLGDNPLKLPVGATEFVGCPFFNGIHCCGIHTEDEAFG